MKRFIIILVLLVFAIVSQVEIVPAKDKEMVKLILTWTQVLPILNGLAGWNILWSDKKGGPYKLWGFVEFWSPQLIYSFPLEFRGVKSSQKYYFVIQSMNADKVVSAYSTEVEANVTKDTTTPNLIPPPVPGGVVIIIE